MMINKEWHARHRMPKNASVEQKIKWHIEHAKHCGCRPMPERLRKLAKRGTGKSGVKTHTRSAPSYRKVLATLRRSKQTLIKQYDIKELGVFGSVVRGDQRKRSDVDILVDFHNVPDLLTFVRLANELEDTLRSKVDLVHKPALRVELKERVLSEVVYV